MTDPNLVRTTSESIQVSGLQAAGGAHQFLVADGTMTVQAAPTPPPLPAPRQLPMDVPAFTGRHSELRRLDRILDHTADRSGFASAVISGPGGIGKTGLAVHWAHRVRDRFSDGELYIDLHGYGPDRPLEPMDALAQLLGSFGLADGDLPQRLSDRAARYRSLLYGKRMLIVLDNAASSKQIRELLPGTATCAVVITSRDRLDSFATRYGPASLSLDVLQPAESVALLAELVGERARDEPEATRTMAQACGHHTLALRIAATTAMTRPEAALSTLAADLDTALGADGLATLSIGDDPHTDLRAVFSWSLRSLADQARRAFILIGLFPVNVLDIYGLAALWALDLDQTEAMAEGLIRAHLLSRSRQDRYHMHDLLRTYAYQLADDEVTSDERARAVNSFLDYHAATASKAMDVYIPIEKALRPDPPQPEAPTPEFDDEAAALAWLDAERVNLLAAALWAADHDLYHHTYRMAFTIFRYLESCGNHYHNERLQAAATGAPHPVQRGRALEYLSVGYINGARFEDAVECTRQAIALAQEAGDEMLEAGNLANLGVLYGKFGRFDDNLACQQRALSMIQRTGPDSEIGRIRNLLGMTYLRTEQFDQAEEHLTAALAIFRAGGSTFFEAVVRNKIGLLRLATGDHTAALAEFEASRARYDLIGNHSQLPLTINSIANTHRELGDLDTAAAHHTEALAMAREFIIVDAEVTILNDLALTLNAQGKPDEALECHRRSLTIARRHGHHLELERAKAGIKAITAT